MSISDFLKNAIATKVARWQTDASGNVIGLVGPAGALVGQLAAITYNSNGTINTYQCDGATWTCAYDAAGRLSTETATGGPTRTYAYDASSGLLTSVTEA